MQTGAAARTYNVLVAENRKVGAALIAVDVSAIGRQAWRGVRPSSSIAKRSSATAIPTATGPPLFAPADKRPYLFALYAFSLEIARVRDCVREPLRGRDPAAMVARRAAGEARGDVRGQPGRGGARRHDRALPPAAAGARRPRRRARLRPLRRPDADPERPRGLLRRDVLDADPARPIILDGGRDPAPPTPPAMPASPMRSRASCALSLGMPGADRFTCPRIFSPGTASCATTSSRGRGGPGTARGARRPARRRPPASGAACGPQRGDPGAGAARIPAGSRWSSLTCRLMERRDYDPFHDRRGPAAVASGLGALARAGRRRPRSRSHGGLHLVRTRRRRSARRLFRRRSRHLAPASHAPRSARARSVSARFLRDRLRRARAAACRPRLSARGRAAERGRN